MSRTFTNYAAPTRGAPRTRKTLRLPEPLSAWLTKYADSNAITENDAIIEALQLLRKTSRTPSTRRRKAT